MKKMLVPVDGSPNSRFAVQHVIGEFMNNTQCRLDLRDLFIMYPCILRCIRHDKSVARNRFILCVSQHVVYRLAAKSCTA